MKKIIFLLLGFFMAFCAHASFPASPYSYSANNNSGASMQYFSTLEAACTYMTTVYRTVGGSCVQVNETNWHHLLPSGDYYYAIVTRADIASCPANSTLGAGQCTCAAGFSQSGSTCTAVVNPCAANAGKFITVNRTEGWFRTPDASDTNAVGPVPSPGPNVLNVGGCRAAVTESKSCYRSQVPTVQGLYRRSCDYEVIQTDQQEALSPTAETNAGAPDATCPGFIGEVNGVKGCYGTAAAPVATTKAPAPAPESPGNPSAGEKPSSGPGAGSGGEGRTPMTGTGGNTGGPSTSAINAKGDGTITKPGDGKEQQACGAPGQPKCGIDESGTPEPLDPMVFKGHADKYKQEQDAARNTISGTSDKGFFSGWSSIFFLPPLASCQVIEMPLGKGTIDPCPVVDGTRGVMAWLWALAGLGLCVHLVRKVV